MINYKEIKCKCGEITRVLIEDHPNHFVSIGCIIEGECLDPKPDGLIRNLKGEVGGNFD